MGNMLVNSERFYQLLNAIWLSDITPICMAFSKRIVPLCFRNVVLNPEGVAGRRAELTKKVVYACANLEYPLNLSLRDFI